MSITYETDVLVTPALAKKWLGLNVDNNRLLKTSRVRDYARDMRRGQWRYPTGETIKFNTDGQLVDGQNRLSAVILSDASIRFDVVKGLPIEVMPVLDSGISRTGADAVKVAGGIDRNRSASIVRWWILWRTGIYTGTGGTFRPTNAEIAEMFTSDADNFVAAARRGNDCRRMALGSGGPQGFAFYLLEQVDHDQAHEFFDQLISGANLNEMSAALVLRNRLTRYKTERLARQEELYLVVKAWNFWREEAPIRSLLLPKPPKTGWKEGRPTVVNDNFPMPK